MYIMSSYDSGATQQTTNRPVETADVNAIIAQSLQLHRAGLTQQALALVHQALSKHPRSATLLCHCGAYCTLLQRHDIAEFAFLEAIKLHPQYADAHYNLGLLYADQRRHAPAEAAYQRAIAIDPAYADAYFNLAVLQKSLGRLADARSTYLQLIALRPGDADAHANLGRLLLNLGQPDEAESMLLRADALQPHNAETLFAMGTLYRQKRQPVQAENAYRATLAIAPDKAAAHSDLGALLAEQQRYDEAQSHYQIALNLQPDLAKAHSNMGNLLKLRGHPHSAEIAYREAIRLAPQDADPHYNLGLLLREQKRPEESESAFRQAIALRPDFAQAHSNLGVLLMEQRREQEAETAYRRALDIQPDFADAHCNLGALFAAKGRPDAAQAAYLRALSIDPDSADTNWNYSLLLLRQGSFAEGWPAYEARYWPHNTITNAKARRLSKGDPLWARQWRGEPLENKTLMVWAEQGFGDEIQFVRYLPLLRSLGLKKLTLVCKQPLTSLFRYQGFADDVISISTQEWAQDVPEEYDFWCYLLSLPLRFQTTLENIPAQLPYLAAPPERIAQWADRLPGQNFRVGLVWNGNARHSNDRFRSLHSLKTLAPLWSATGVTFISMQTDVDKSQIDACAALQPLQHLGSCITDFADTAAILSHIDLLITVDTATAHLAGAMGVPCWVMLPHYCPDWRWLDGRTDSPWYPNVVRLFRQTKDGDWGAVMEQVALALSQRQRTIAA